MNITVQRYSTSKNDTLGLLFINCQFQCYTLEDEYRSVKKWGETRIPAGTYKVKLRTEGGFDTKYLHKFGGVFHKGMLWIKDVPGFEYILIHIGNDEDDTAGCLLVGNSVNNNQITRAFLSNSTNAYKSMYPKVRDAIIEGQEVTITIKDEGQLDV